MRRFRRKNDGNSLPSVAAVVGHFQKPELLQVEICCKVCVDCALKMLREGRLKRVEIFSSVRAQG